MATYTISLTDPLNKTLGVDSTYTPTADERLPKALDKEGAMDTLDEHGVSVQRTAYIQVMVSGGVKPGQNHGMGIDHEGRPTALADGDSFTDTAQTPLNYPGLDIT